MRFDDEARGPEAPVAADVAAGAGAPERGYVRFSAAVAREVCRRLAAGATQAEVCADPSMPCSATLWRWARARRGFAVAFARARALGGRGANGKARAFCPVAAAEIVARVSEGETLSAVCADPAMPSLSTVFRWRANEPEFDAEMRLAREALAERFGDLGWKLAMEATPETAFLTQVRLKQLRWTAAVLGPRTHGRLKPAEPPAPPEVDTVLLRHFKVEVNRETGQHRVVGYTPDPDTMQPVRTSEGPWEDPIDPVAKAAGIQALIEARPAGPRLEARGGGEPDDDPEGWR